MCHHAYFFLLSSNTKTDDCTMTSSDSLNIYHLSKAVKSQVLSINLVCTELHCCTRNNFLQTLFSENNISQIFIFLTTCLPVIADVTLALHMSKDKGLSMLIVSLTWHLVCRHVGLCVRMKAHMHVQM